MDKIVKNIKKKLYDKIQLIKNIKINYCIKFKLIKKGYWKIM